MQLNPAIVIPTYWTSRRASARRGLVYDHMTPIDKPGELPRCLESLSKIPGVPRIFLLVVSEPAKLAAQAAENVRVIASRFPNLDTIVVGEAELAHIHRRMEQDGMGELKNFACLKGYGAIRNLGILVASIFSHDTVVFLDDDEVVTQRNFMESALYGIGSKSPQGEIVAAKTGYSVNEEGDWHMEVDNRWYRKAWDTSSAINELLEKTIKGPRLSVAQYAYGGCMVLHAEAFGKVAFDPWINRGEDLDYVISSRMYDQDVWFDNKLMITHEPPEMPSQGSVRFEQDMFRWFYESRKIEFAKAQIDLMQIDTTSLNPYPGPWVTKKIKSKMRKTCLYSIIADPEHFTYWGIWRQGRKQAAEKARTHCARYFELQQQWPSLVRTLWNCIALAAQVAGHRYK